MATILACILTAISAIGALLACALGHGAAFAALSLITFTAFGITAIIAVTHFIWGKK